LVFLETLQFKRSTAETWNAQPAHGSSYKENRLGEGEAKRTPFRVRWGRKGDGQKSGLWRLQEEKRCQKTPSSPQSEVWTVKKKQLVCRGRGEKKEAGKGALVALAFAELKSKEIM